MEHARLALAERRSRIPVVIIATNVGHNLAITRAAWSPQLLGQIAFLLFVAATARTAWRGARG